MNLRPRENSHMVDGDGAGNQASVSTAASSVESRLAICCFSFQDKNYLFVFVPVPVCVKTLSVFPCVFVLNGNINSRNALVSSHKITPGYLLTFTLRFRSDTQATYVFYCAVISRLSSPSYPKRFSVFICIPVLPQHKAESLWFGNECERPQVEPELP